MAGPVLGWLQVHRPDAVARAARALSPKDWLRSRLVPGSLVTDASDASATLMWDVFADDWCTGLLEEAGLPVELLPEVRPSDAEAGRIPGDVARSWGLPEGIPVAVGCADVAATMLAVEDPDAVAAVVLGTGAQAVAMGVVPQRSSAPRHHTYRATDDRRYAMVASTNAGLALTRVCTLLGIEWPELYASPFDALGPDDPVFLPFFAAERLPDPLPGGRASWRRLSSHGGRELLAASAVEAVLFGVRRALEALPVGRGPVQVAGGGTADPRVRQFLADALDRPLLVSEARDATALGAAHLALRTLGRAPKRRVGSLALLRPSRSVDERYDLYRRELERALLD
ncbi:xylulokinase [Microbacterium neungamense]|uniref:xylulokinase n=1 Tax=Microbacterium neungamense TaxID=2810535 RepID=UPI00217DE1DB|nr:FGGY-family carbohydrate kinase [Microbacterium neungamense]